MILKNVKSIKKIAVITTVFFCLSTACTFSVDAAEQPLEPVGQEDIIYFIMTDRFYDGDSSNNYNVIPKDLGAYHGGDFKGITQKMDYLKELGVTAIWISPPYDNQSFGYHGYWVRDFYNTEEHFGTMEELRKLVKTAHAKGIKVLLDMVVNHTGLQHPWVTDEAYKDWFHDTGTIRNFNDPNELENGRLAGLPDLAQENPEVRKYFIENCKWWIEQTGVDGFRFDTVRHVPKDFWKELIQAIKKEYPDFYIIGEVFDGNLQNVASYQSTGMDGMLDFPMYFAIHDVFARSSAMQRLVGAINAGKNLPNRHLWGTFVDNHDVQRFINVAGRNREKKLQQAITFMMTYTGIPVIYYGTEIGLNGGADPDNRRDMEWGKQSNIYPYLKKLINIRKNHPALTRGNFEILDYDDNYISYVRQYEDDVILTVFNTMNKENVKEVLLTDSLSEKWNTAVDLLEQTKKYDVLGGKMKITLPPNGSKVLLLAKEKNVVSSTALIGVLAAALTITFFVLQKTIRKRK